MFRERGRRLAALGLVLCILSWLGAACRSAPATPENATPPTAVATPTLTRSPTSTPPPVAASPTPSREGAPTPTPLPLTDAEAISLVHEEVAARGVVSSTIRATIEGDPRWASIRYSSSYDTDGSVFRAQNVLVAIAIARVMARVQPPIDGGIRVAVMPGEESEIGLRVLLIDGSGLQAWSSGYISDQEFVRQWTVGIVTKD